jgi:hypothetical protein
VEIPAYVIACLEEVRQLGECGMTDADCVMAVIRRQDGADMVQAYRWLSADRGANAPRAVSAQGERYRAAIAALPRED